MAQPRQRRGIWTTNLRTARVLRFAIGVTAAAALAFGYEWPLSFLTPVFTGVFLSLPLPALTLRQSLRNCYYVVEAFVLGLVFTLFLLPFPLIYIPSLGLVLFHNFYTLNRGGSFWRVLMHTIAVLILPMLGQLHDIVSEGFALYFILSGVLAILLYQLAHGLFPDPAGGPKLPISGGIKPGYVPEAALAALKSTLIILPLAALFIAMEWTGQILVMVYAAIFSLSPVLSTGKAAALKSLTSTVVGGLAALVFYWLIVAVPEFHFFIALMLLTTLVFALGSGNSQQRAVIAGARHSSPAPNFRSFHMLYCYSVTSASAQIAYVVNLPVAVIAPWLVNLHSHPGVPEVNG